MLVPEVHRSRIFRQTAGWNYPALVVDGWAAGVWSLKKRARQIALELETFRPLNSNEKKGIQQEAEDIGLFLDSHVEVRFASSRLK